MDVERSTISAVVKAQTMEGVVTREIRPEHFLDYECRQVWEWMTAHLRRYRSVPSHDLFIRRWPSFLLLDVTDPLEAIVTELIKVIKRRSLIDTVRHLSDIADDWALVEDAEVHVFEAARDLAQLVPTTSVTRFSDSLSRLELHRLRQESGATPGVSLLASELDDLTYGVQTHEMAIIQGFLGRGKSSLAIGQAARAYFERDQSPLFMSLEMEGDKLANRWDAVAARISYHALKRLETTEEDHERWYRIGERAQAAKLEKDIIVIDDLYKPSVDRIFAEIERWAPTYTVVDTIDEVSAPSQYRTMWEQQAYAARELKAVARATKKPVVGIAQSGRDAEEHGARIGNIAGSIDIARKADIVVGLHATDEMLKKKMMVLRLLKNRDDQGTGSEFKYFWDVGSMTYRPWQEADAIPERETVS